MKKLKIIDGRIRFALRTFDGSYVIQEMNAENAEKMLEKAEESNLLPGFGLVCDDKWFFETEEEKVVLKAKKNKE